MAPLTIREANKHYIFFFIFHAVHFFSLTSMLIGKKQTHNNNNNNSCCGYYEFKIIILFNMDKLLALSCDSADCKPFVSFKVWPFISMQILNFEC